jgi:hypothetical protein
MHLRNPGTIDAAIQTLTQLKIDCDNCRSGYTSFLDARKAYLNWVDTAYGQLHSLVVNGDLADGLYSPFFFEICRMDAGTRPAWTLLRRELQTQSERLQAALEKLAGLKAFAGRNGHIVVPDTSALVQGVWLEDFDWPAELGLTPPVRLVIPILVIEELDKLKDQERKSKAGDRARRVVRHLRALCGPVPPGHPAGLQKRKNVTVEVLLDEDWHARRPNNDGEIVDQALLVKALTGQDVRLVCVDAAMEFRARQHGLTVSAMPTPEEVQASTGPAPTS